MMRDTLNNKPTVSVVMSFCDEPLQWLRLAVGSILEQTFTDFELLIVCDNPGAKECIGYIKEKASEDTRVHIIMNESNLGPTKSFNIAIRQAEGQYIARMDADDIAFKERFERQVAFLKSHPEISACASDVHIINEEGEITRRNKYHNKRDQSLHFIYNTIAHPTVMFRKSLKELRNPIYNEEYIYSQDYELWQHLLLNGHKIFTLDETLLLYRKSRSQISVAKRREQVELFKKAHKKFILGWLISHGVIDESDCDNLKCILKKASKAFRTSKGEDRRALTLIIYVLYFSLATTDWKYKFIYPFDRNLIIFRIEFIFSVRFYVSQKTRRNRTGFL